MKKSIDNYVLELLQERSLSKEYEKKVNDYVKVITAILKKKPTKEILSGVEDTECPIDSKGDKLVYQPPSKVFLSGGFAWGSAYLSENMDVDLVVQIPKECMHSKDYLNEGVLRRRAQYLQYLATILSNTTSNNPSVTPTMSTKASSKSNTGSTNTSTTDSNTTSTKLIDHAAYMYKHGRQKMPVLVLYPAEETGIAHTRIIVHTCIQEAAFKLNRFHVRKNNVRSRWYSFKTHSEGTEKTDLNYVSLDAKCKEPLSSRHNSWVLEQLVTEGDHAFVEAVLGKLFGVRQAVVLVKIWMERRGLNKGFSSGLFVNFLTAYLLLQGNIKKNNSVMQHFKAILVFLAEGKLKTEGISLSKKKLKEGVKGGKIVEGDEKTADGKKSDGGDEYFKPSMDEFMSVYDVVFVDPSGYLNICHDLHASIYHNLCYEADKTLKLLASCQLDTFQVTFLNENPVVCKFDRIIHIHAEERIRHLCNSSSTLQNHFVDQAGDANLAFLSLLMPILTLGLEGRQILLTILPSEAVEKPTTQKIDHSHSGHHLTFGLILNHLTSNNTQVVGPSADKHEEVHEFQKFWGERSEQLRYMGGEIKEVVRWPGDNVADSRTIVSRIIKFIMMRHFGITKECVSISDNQLDGLLKSAEKKNASDLSVYGTGEEQIEQVIQSLDKLSKILRSLTDLPLSFNSVQGIAAIFRYSEVFPPVRSTCQSDAGVYKFMLVPVHRNNCPQLFPSYDVVCFLEGSSKWADDAEAMEKLKMAFYKHLGKQLRHKHQYSCLIYPNKLMLHSPPETFVFNLRLGIGKEIQLSRRVELGNGMVQMMDTPLYLELNHIFNVMPVYTSIMHGIQQKNNNFSGSLRLAKRWLSSQLLLGYIPEEVIELLVAHVFIPSPPSQYDSPSSTLLGFVRFLQVVSTHDWKLDPLVVNLNEEFKDADYSEIEEYFHQQRPQLPAMVICTPLDKHSQMWTTTRPTAVMLTRMVLAARASLSVLSDVCLHLPLYNKKDFKQLFRPPTEDYNVLLHLNLHKCSRYHHGVDFLFESSHPPPNTISRSESLFPVVDFDPSSSFLSDLKNEFENFALFFYDVYGGTYIAIAWKPSAFKPVPFKDSASKYYRVVEDTLNSEQAMMVACEDAMLKKIKNMGSLIVKRTEIINQLI